MANSARKLRRMRQRKAAGFDAHAWLANNEPTLDHLLETAATSLGFSEAQVSEAHTGEGELADMLQARAAELIEATDGSSPLTQHLRGEVEARRGADFLARVAAMGEPARDVVRRLFGIVGAALFVLLLSPRDAAAALPETSVRVDRSVSYAQRRRRWAGWLPQTRARRGLRRSVAKCTAEKCNTTTASFESSRRGSRSSGPLLANGSWREPASSRRSSRSRSSSAGAAGSGTRARLHAPIPCSAFVAVTAASSARRTRDLGVWG